MAWEGKKSWRRRSKKHPTTDAHVLTHTRTHLQAGALHSFKEQPDIQSTGEIQTYYIRKLLLVFDPSKKKKKPNSSFSHINFSPNTKNTKATHTRANKQPVTRVMLSWQRWDLFLPDSDEDVTAWFERAKSQHDSKLK